VIAAGRLNGREIVKMLRAAGARKSGNKRAELRLGAVG